MELDFLQRFPERMKVVGIHSLLVKNSGQKTTWKQYGIENFDEQLNILFSVLLYIMEQSLCDEPCTIDDVASFLDELNMTYFKKGLTYIQCRELGDFIINVILCDEGRAMYFQGFNYDTGLYEKQHISYVANRIVYLSDAVRRTSYYLTEDGYNLLLSTLEVESNMKLTIQEMIFKLHLEKASYDKAANDMRTIFNMLQVQFQKIQEAMRRIRQNALRYAVTEYQQLLEENLNVIEDSNQRFSLYRERVNKLVKELTEEDVHAEKLGMTNQENLAYLEIIERYLNRALDEHQRILTSHFDMKALYNSELESLSQMAMIKRFDLRNELDEPLLNDVRLLERMEIFLRPLFNQVPEKVYNMNLAFQKQQSLRHRQMEEEELLEFDEQDWQQSQREKRNQRIQACCGSLQQILEQTANNGGSLTLSKLIEVLNGELQTLIPTTEIFQEVVIELLRSQTICLAVLREEQQTVLQDHLLDFQLNQAVLDIFDFHPDWNRVAVITIQRLVQEEPVLITGVKDEKGLVKRIRCTDFQIQFLREGGALCRMN